MMVTSPKQFFSDWQYAVFEHDHLHYQCGVKSMVYFENGNKITNFAIKLPNDVFVYKHDSSFKSVATNVRMSPNETDSPFDLDSVVALLAIMKSGDQVGASKTHRRFLIPKITATE